MIPFNKPPLTGNEKKFVLEAMKSDKISGGGKFTEKCQRWFEDNIGCEKALLTPSCTQALEMAGILIDIQPGDEVIMPSYTFVSTANAFVLRGARIVFIDIRPDTMNMDERMIEEAITAKTKAIVPVHYAGVSCNMTAIMEIAARHGLFVVEDAAHGIMSAFNGKPLGSIGHLAAYSFHETKNVTSGGEGGLLLVNDGNFIERAEIIREKGTNRRLFFSGMVDKYTWVDIGSSYMPSEIQAAFLWGQLECIDNITKNRMDSWNAYYRDFLDAASDGILELPSIPNECRHNGHMFYIKMRDLEERNALLSHIKNDDILAVFHYVPLHSSKAGIRFSRFHGKDVHTTRESERLIRLPLWYGMEDGIRARVVESINSFLSKRT